MQPNHFRAYAIDTAKSRRPNPAGPGNANVEHDVHNSVVEGAVKDGEATFTAKQEIAYVALYAGKGDDQVCVGRIDGPFKPGKITVDYADVPQSAAVDLGNGEFEQNGTVYRKAD